MKKVAVLGGGGTGCCFAGELALRGYEVRLYEEKAYWNEHIDGILAAGHLEVVGNGLTGTAKLAMITDDIGKAIDGVEMIFISMVAWRHQSLAEALKPHVKPGQVLVLSAGNFGSLVLRKTLGMDSGVLIGEMQGNIFPCRMVGDAKALLAAPYKPKRVAAFPGKDTPALVQVMNQYIECTPAKNVFETAFNIPNLVIHLCASILNTCAIDRNPDFRLYTDGLSESVLKCLLAVEAEKAQVMERMGYLMVNSTDNMKIVMDYGHHPEKDLFRSLKGPSSMAHRYIVEDASVGQSMMIDLAERLGLDMPVMKSLVKLASVINGRDFRATGLKLADLGMGNLNTPEEINEYLQTGVAKEG